MSSGTGAALSIAELLLRPASNKEEKICGWTIRTRESHILKSKCTKGNQCPENDKEACSFCLYNRQLGLPHLPDMVFADNVLSVRHDASGFGIEFTALDALQKVDVGSRDIKIACADEWKASRSDQPHVEQEAKPFDWTFSTNYSGTLLGGLKSEATDLRIDLQKLKQREKILFYTDITLFEDELHDNGTAICTVKIRVMPSGFYVLLRFFLRVDDVVVRVNDTRLYHEFGTAYLLREFTGRESKIQDLAVPTASLVDPNEVTTIVPVKTSSFEVLKLPQPSEAPDTAGILAGGPPTST